MVTYRKHEYSQYCSERMNVGLRMAATCFLGILLVFHPSHLQADETQPVESQTEVAQTATEITKARERRGRNPIGISTADNGVTIVNIAAPKGSANLSHNKYDKFIIGQQGAILNNSNQNDHTSVSDQTSVLGGQIATNSNLRSAGSASVILNEIKSSHPSMLKGRLEVHGQNAELIIANPNGITCDGCDFINTSQVTLATGTPAVDATSGEVSEIVVTGGQITIGNNGASLEDIDIFNLVSRTISVNGPVRVKDRLNLFAGRNRYQQGLTTPLATDNSEPTLAIDSSVMGGMYAGRIQIISNDQGAGVNMNGPVVANAHGVTMTANGGLTLKDVQANETGNQASSGDITITATRINLSRATDDNTDALNATDDITLNTGEITLLNRNSIEAHNSRITALGALDINSSSQINLAGGIYYAGGALNVEGTSITNNADLNSENTATLSSTTGKIYNYGRVAGDEGTIVTSANTLKNLGKLHSAKNITATAIDLWNGSSAQILAKGDITLTPIMLLNTGMINGNNSLTIRASSIDNGNRGSIGSATGSNLVEINNGINNTGLFYSGTSSLFKLGGAFTNTGANVVAETDLTIRGLTSGAQAASITNSSGNIEAISGDMTLGATTITNKPSMISFSTIVSQSAPSQSGDTTTTVKTTRDTVAKSISSKLLAGGDITINAQTLNNNYSQIAANEEITINANRINNEGRNLSQTVETTTVTRINRKECAHPKIFGGCANYHHWVETSTNVDRVISTYSRVHGTIKAGDTLTGTVSGYRQNNAVQDSVEQFALSSSNRTLGTINLDEVSASKSLVELGDSSSE